MNQGTEWISCSCRGRQHWKHRSTNDSQCYHSKRLLFFSGGDLLKSYTSPCSQLDLLVTRHSGENRHPPFTFTLKIPTVTCLKMPPNGNLNASFQQNCQPFVIRRWRSHLFYLLFSKVKIFYSKISVLSQIFFP